ncbi:MAG: MBL fold metallo-hydrolase [Aminipila sp.]
MHVHWDHICGHKFFSDIAVYETEKDWLSSKFPIPLQVVKSNLTKEPCDFPPDFDITKYQIFQGMPERILEDGDLFDLEKRTVKVIHTHGHSPGHICLYELERKYLYSGDLIYKGILYAFYPTTYPIKLMKSVQKVKKLKVERILSGHNKLNIPTTIISEIDNGFTEIFDSGNLKEGTGIFKFSNFQIHI